MAKFLDYTGLSHFKDKNDALYGKASDVADLKSAVNNAVANVTDVLRAVRFDFPVTWTTGGYLNVNGGITSNANYEYTEEYVGVFPGGKIDCALYAPGASDYGIFFYDANKTPIQNSGLHTTGALQTVDVPSTASFVRFGNKLTNTYKIIRNHVDDDSDNICYFVVDHDTPNDNQTLRQFDPKTERIEHRYTGEVTPQKRFVTFGFDDLRYSDVDLIMPLFTKYGMSATFNRVVKSSLQSPYDERGIKQVLCGKHELGDHTFLHYSFPYFNPLWNGQDPTAPDGSQTPCPTNADFREEYANGKNKFGFALTDIVNVSGSGVSGVAWGNLTDAQCQTLRSNFSVMGNSALIGILDNLSNKYLGTTGNSAGSWSNGEYTGGIFTGMKTSENHEVWERIQTVMQIALKDLYGVNYEMQTWSRPGSMVFPHFTDGTSYFYDSAFTIPASPQTKIESSLYENETGAAKDRSWTDVLREFGYRITHDYPNEVRYVFVGSQFYMNESGRKKDCIPCPSNYKISYSVLRNEYPETFFTSGKTKAAQMYDATGTFRSYIETIRNRCANGAIPSEMIDSYDTYSFRVFFENLLRFCQQEGFELIPKAEAFDICFNHSVTNGNLLYNPQLKNSAEDFFTDATNIPTAPDGYTGTCAVRQDEVPVLVTSGETIYTHYGIPCGDLAFKCKAKGTGTIKVYAFRNNDQVNGSLTGYDLLDTVSVASADEFSDCASNFTIADAPMEEYDRIYEGYAQKIVGIKIVFSSGLEIKRQSLKLVD